MLAVGSQEATFSDTGRQLQVKAQRFGKLVVIYRKPEFIHSHDEIKFQHYRCIFRV
jgi:hypothetical protein